MKERDVTPVLLNNKPDPIKHSTKMTEILFKLHQTNYQIQ